MTNIDFDDYIQDKLKNPEYQREWLRTTALEYIKTGNYENFFSDLEDVIKANSTVSEFARKIDMDRVQLTKILKGKTKAPTIATINKILDGLGYEIKIQLKSA